MIAHKTGGTKMSQAPTGPSEDLVPERKPTISKIANPTTSMARMLQNIFVIGSVFMPLRAQGEERIDHSGDDAQFSFRLARQYSGTELAILFERHSGQPRITVRDSAIRNPGFCRDRSRPVPTGFPKFSRRRSLSLVLGQ